jgi:hypothetical protein
MVWAEVYVWYERSLRMHLVLANLIPALECTLLLRTVIMVMFLIL